MHPRNHRHLTTGRPRRGPFPVGFTLVELVLCLVIVGTVAGIAVPRYAEALARYHLDAAARRVVADIDHARTHAEANSSTVTLFFVPATDRINAPALPGLAANDPHHQTDLAAEPYRVDLTVADFAGETRLDFDGYGVPVAGGTVTLRAGTGAKSITVDAETGEATIQ